MLAATAFLLCTAFLAAAERSLTVEFVTRSANLNNTSDLFINITVKNTGDEKLSILRDPRSVLSIHPTDRLSIWSPAGVSPLFSGIHTRYIPEAVIKANPANSIVVLESGKSEHIICDLSVYRFEESPGYTFLIKPNRFLIVETNGSISSIQPHSTGINITVPFGFNLPRHPPTPRAVLPTARAIATSVVIPSVPTAPPRYSGCSANQKDIISSAANLARKYIDEGLKDSQQDLKSNPKSAARLSRWFGGKTNDAYTGVRNKLQYLSATVGAQVVYDCTCSALDLSGFVDSNNNTNLYLCSEFWNLPATDAGSQADTLINLGTYANMYPNAHGLAYGLSDSLALAKSGDYISAAANPDNYAFYAVGA